MRQCWVFGVAALVGGRGGAATRLGSCSVDRGGGACALTPETPQWAHSLRFGGGGMGWGGCPHLRGRDLHRAPCVALRAALDGAQSLRAPSRELSPSELPRDAGVTCCFWNAALLPPCARCHVCAHGSLMLALMPPLWLVAPPPCTPARRCSIEPSARSSHQPSAGRCSRLHIAELENIGSAHSCGLATRATRGSGGCMRGRLGALRACLQPGNCALW